MGAQWKVKHKEAASNAKGKIFGKLVKEITIAARNRCRHRDQRPPASGSGAGQKSLDA